MPFLNYQPLKLQLRVFLSGHTVAMVTYDVMESVATICYDLGPRVGTWVLPITHGTWQSVFEREKKETAILKLEVTRICCEAE